MIASADGAFNSVIRFYETKRAKQPNLFGTGLRLAGTIPRMALKNTSSSPITATPKFIPLGGVNAGEPVTLPALALAPQQTAEVDLGPVMNAAKHRGDLGTVSVQVTNNGAPGSLIGALYSSDKTIGINYDVPLRDSGPVRNMTGAYPWKISDDYTTIVYLTNISDGPAEFVAQINYDGGKYVVGLRKLSAGETAVFDIRQMIAEEKMDEGNRKLPKHLQLGQFTWMVHGATGGKIILTGRAEMVSLSQRISTSYSCAEGCMQGFGGAIERDHTIFAVGETYTVSAWETMYFGAGQPIGPYLANGTWSLGPSSVMNLTVDSSGRAVCTGVAPGVAVLSFLSSTQNVYVWDGLDCLFAGQQFWDDGVEMTVKPTIDRLEPDRGLIGQTHRVTVVGEGFEAPAGVTVAGSGITANVNSVGPSSIVVDFVVAADAGLGNHAVTVTVSGQTSNSVNFFVQEPKKLRRDQITEVIDIDPGPGDIKDIFNQIVAQSACGAYRNLKYTLVDQDSQAQPIKFEDGVQIIEQLSDYQGPTELQSKLIPFNNFTNNIGEIGDVVGIAGPSPNCPPQFMLSFKQGFKAKVGNKEWTLTTVNSISMVKAADGTYTITVTNTTP